MRIGFDMDEVLINTPPLISKSLIDKLYKKRDNGILLYRIPSWPEQILRLITHLPILRPAMKDNMQYVKSLTKEKHKLYLISSRFKFLEKRTRQIISKYGFDDIFDEMYFNFGNEQPHIFKSRIIAKLKLDYYIDDDLSLLNFVAKNNMRTNFFWLDHMRAKKNHAGNIKSISKLSEMRGKLK